ncbi:DNA polymerase III subunit beta [Bacillus sp. NEB1478]|uniref:DNA polymerase III subunit beta n=1 Tax=Bacillus sp. NEB1478 TaxID=3073816 RepID=UPI0028730DCC|nr:DNA polymerase III subunit beta [Bacillus sp. NEB1478]WNB91103.1 DNA polymerase III subunit beta [Bacillus sp. NEB1478]
MELNIHQVVFSKALNEVGRTISSRTSLPILSGIKIIAENDGITLIGSNADIIIERKIPLQIEGTTVAEVIQTGSVVVSAKYFTELIKKLPGTISVKTNKMNSITVTTGEIITHFNGFDADDYPALPTFSVGNHIYIECSDIIEVMKQTSFAASKNETRPVLTGVNLTFTNGRLTAVATDSIRLALHEFAIDSPFEGSIILPNTSVTELLKLLNHYSGKVELQITESSILFIMGDIYLYSRLIAGNYPNTSSLIPNDHKTELILNRESLIKGMDRASLFANEWKNNNVKLSMTNEQKLSISSSSSERGTIAETQEIIRFEGEEELIISIDGNFMLDAIKAIKDSEIKVKFSGTMKPIIIESAEEKSPYLHLISPVRSY